MLAREIQIVLFIVLILRIALRGILLQSNQICGVLYSKFE